MTVVNYYTVAGQLLGEHTTGQTPRDYVTDALGSVVGTVTSAGQAENTYRYKPYGALLAKTGTAPDPAFTWVGSQGYRQTGKKYSDVYVRARHYDSMDGRWTTKDPVRTPMSRDLYVYSVLNPMTLVDPTGNDPAVGLTPIPCDRHINNVCGFVSFVIKWGGLRTSDPGMIVQHVTRSSNIYVCTTPSPGCPPTCSGIPKSNAANPSNEYYERWDVDAQGNADGPDLFSTALEGPGSCGNITVNGLAMFISKTSKDYKDNPNCWQQVPRSSSYPNLQWVCAGVPPGYKDENATTAHSLYYSYDCCNDPRTNSFFTAPWPTTAPYVGDAGNHC
jgi:RHS repeat-associated protein